MEDAQENNGSPVMPPEMWNAVFSHLEPDDLLNVRRACKEFEAVLIWKESVIYVQNVLPMLGKQLSLQNLLALRGTCKDLRTTVDQMLECYINRTKLALFKDDWGHNNAFHPNLLRQLGKFYTFPGSVSEIATQSYKVHAFLEKMGDHSGNPFIGRSVRLQFADIKVDDEYPRYSHQSSDLAIELLCRFGQHLTHFTHFIPCSLAKHVFFEAITDLPNILNKLPNLQSLFLDWKSEAHHGFWSNQIESRALLDRHEEPLTLLRYPPDEFDLGNNEDALMAHFPNMQRVPGYGEMPHCMANISLPPLPNLTTLHLDFHYSYNYVQYITGLSLLHAYGRQITTFICNGDTFLCYPACNLDFPWKNPVLKLLPNLTYLRINDTGYSTPHILGRERLRVPLKQLQLSNDEGWVFDWYVFMRILDNFSDTLEYLKFDMDLRLERVEGQHFTKKQVPNLKHLSTRVCNLDRVAFWEVIPPKCKAIEKLDLRVGEDFRWENVGVRHEKLQRVFHKLPKLEQVYFWADGRIEPVKVLYRSTFYVAENELEINLAEWLLIGD